MSLWNTFEQVESTLRERFWSYAWQPSNAPSREEMQAKLREYEASHLQESAMTRRAAMIALYMDTVGIAVDADDWFGGVTNGYGDFMRVRDEIKRTYAERGWSGYPRSEVSRRAGWADLDLSHTSPDWYDIMRLGICGLRDRAAEALAQHDPTDTEGCEFLRAVVTVYDALRRLVLRFADEASRVGAVRCEGVLRGIAEHAPRTFHEGLQLGLIYRLAQEMSGINVRSEGIFTQIYIDLYRKDLAEGRLTREQAKELVKFWSNRLLALNFKANHNVCLGGTDAQGQDLHNELTELMLDAFDERGQIDPKLTIRVSKATPDSVLLRCARSLRHGATSMVFANDDAAYPMFLRSGRDASELYRFVAIGCYEPALCGLEMNCSMSAYYNFAGIFESLLEEESSPASMEEVLERYLALQRQALQEILAAECAGEPYWKEVNPSPVLSGSMGECIRKARDVSNAGTKYNMSGVMCAGIGTAADALAAIEYLVFDKKRCSWQELRQAIHANWEGFEALRREALFAAPKYGRNDPRADRFAVTLSNAAGELIDSTPNTRGGHFQMGNWSIDWSVMMGKLTKATPDGRCNEEPLSKNLGATIGKDNQGVTNLLLSAMKLDSTLFMDGSVLDVMLHPTVAQGPGGDLIFVQLIRSYFAGGGLFLHFNVVDAGELRAAKREPEKYQNLQVRVCGWSQRFVTLSPEMQDCFIAEAESKTP
ncbi:MAG: hypothetical protein IJJ26_11760 [Victivallales bacterium]|nr:hypothetical protein [Victivallales bacterium]